MDCGEYKNLRHFHLYYSFGYFSSAFISYSRAGRFLTHNASLRAHHLLPLRLLLQRNLPMHSSWPNSATCNSFLCTHAQPHFSVLYLNSNIPNLVLSAISKNSISKCGSFRDVHISTAVKFIGTQFLIHSAPHYCVTRNYD